MLWSIRLRKEVGKVISCAHEWDGKYTLFDLLSNEEVSAIDVLGAVDYSTSHDLPRYPWTTKRGFQH